MMYLKYPRGHGLSYNGYPWVPKLIRNIEVKNIKILKMGVRSKTGFFFDICQAEISDEDACYITLMKDNEKQRTLEISSESFLK